MRQTVKQFESWLRASGVYCSEITDGTTNEVGIFIDYRDCTSKRKEKQVAAMAKRLGVKINLSDKGVCFF